MHWKFLANYGNINSVFHSDKISADSKYLNRFASEMILWFPWKYNIFSLIQIWIEWHMDGCPFKSGFNLSTDVLTSMESNISSAANCLITVYT